MGSGSESVGQKAPIISIVSRECLPVTPCYFRRRNTLSALSQPQMYLHPSSLTHSQRREALVDAGVYQHIPLLPFRKHGVT